MMCDHRWIKQYQQQAYQLQPVPDFQDYLRKILEQPVDVKELWNLSLQVLHYSFLIV